MRRTRFTFLALLALMAGLLVWLARRNPQPPLLPRDEDHREFRGAEACLACHDAGGPLPQSQNHPLGRECLRCHGLR